MNKFQDRVAIITGGSQGIGQAYCRGFAEERAVVIIADINEHKGIQLEKELTERGLSAKFIKVDVSNPSSVAAMTEQVTAQYGRVDFLINNAAIFSSLKLKPFEEISIEEWNQVIAVNLTGVFVCCQAVVPLMRKQKYGRIVNVSSGTVLAGRPFYLHYVSSKAAIVGFTRALAREVGADGIHVNTISPGGTFTEVERESYTREQAEKDLKNQCIQRLSTPEDMVGVVSFLCSDDANYLSGQMIEVDGGKYMH